MNDLCPFVVEALTSLKDSFQPDELAYLALTSKVENTIRDRLAFALHRTLEGQNLLVCREWNRRDLAIVEGNSPRLLLEAKAYYSFDIVKLGTPHPYPKELKNDIVKAGKWSSSHPNVEVLSLLMVTHPCSAPEAEFRRAVKYYSGVKKYSKPECTVEVIDQKVRNTVPARVIKHGVFAGGNAFGVDVSVIYWLFQGKMAPDLPSSEPDFPAILT